MKSPDEAPSKSRRWLWSSLTVVIDQISKELLLGYLLKSGQVVSVFDGFFRLVMSGTGASASGCWAATAPCRPGFSRRSPWRSASRLFIWLRRSDRRLHGWGIGLVIGGAIGNVIDRARWGAVFDFADFHIGQWHWPAFNVADSAIVVGVGLMLIDSLDRRKTARALMRP